jgi:hypothetical protein
MGVKMENKLQVFISYAREDFDAAERIYSSLTNIGVRVWMDDKSLLPGEKWKPSINKAIQESRYFIALLSTNSVSKKGYVQKELKIALEVLEEYPNNEIFIIPVRLDECNPNYQQIHELNWVNFFPSWEDGMKKVKLFFSKNLEVNSFEKIDKIELITKLCDINFLESLTNKLMHNNEIKLYLLNYLNMIPIDIKNEVIKLKNMELYIDDFSKCLEFYYLWHCGNLDSKNKCHVCNKKGSIIHGTIDGGGGSMSDYNDNYISWCLNCFWAYYYFEVDYWGKGPLEFDYKQNIFINNTNSVYIERDV